MKKIVASVLLASFIGLNQICFAASAFEQMDINSTIVPLNSRFKKFYSGYEYTITNNLNKPVNIINAQIKNGQDGNVAFQSSECEGGIGTTWAIAGPVGLFTFGIGWAVGLVATPIVAVAQNKKNKKMQTEGLAYTNSVPLGVINAGESVTFKTLVPIGAQPQLKLTIMDEKKNIETINR